MYDMLEIKYEVIEISGDYVTCRSEKGSTTDIAIYLLPEGVDIGDILLFKDLSYDKIGHIKQVSKSL